MNQSFEDILYNNPRNYIRDVTLIRGLSNSTNSREALVKRALKKRTLIQLKKGLYLIGKPYNKQSPNLYEIAQSLYGPSYISLESALSFHGWIPEAVYTVTSVSTKRAKEFTTPVGNLSFSRVPLENFYVGVERIESADGVFLMATAWKALADYFYIYRKDWQKIEDITSDLRIEPEYFHSANLKSLEEIIKAYASRRVKNFLSKILKEIK